MSLFARHRTEPAASRAADLLMSAAPVTLLAIALGGFWGAAPARAQTPAPARGSIAGAIIDAENGHPIRAATVVLTPEGAGVFPGPAAGSAFAAAGRTVLSDSAGLYHFDALPPGAYRLYISRYSYRPYAVTVELSAGAAPQVSVGLRAEPIALQRVEGRGPALSPFRALDVDGATADNRLLALSLRRRRYLTTDVRELTDADVSEAVTLGEPDVFRALQRLPGVAAPSDYSAELWTRGAPWSHTRVYFDGVPLFNPLHTLGVLSGVGSGALGAVWFHPGTRSAAIGGGAAGVVDLRSRPPVGAGELNLQADASLLSTGVAVDQRLLDGRVGWMLSGRTTYLDWLSELSRSATGSGEAFPYGFRELVGRVEARPGGRWLVEASGLLETDHLGRDSVDALAPLETRWSNRLGQVAVSTHLRGLNVRHAFGVSRHHADTRGEPVAGAEGRSWTRSTSDVRFASVTGSLWPDATTLAGPAWSAGYGMEWHRGAYSGPVPLPVPRSELFLYPDTVPESLWRNWHQTLPVAVVWGERTWAPDERIALRTGLRVEAGPEARDLGPVRLSPRLGARVAATPQLALSAGYSRIFQYSQVLAPAGVHLASLTSGDAWFVAGDYFPAVRADVMTFGIEGWDGPGRVAAINWFGRRTTGAAVSDPRPGPVFGRTHIESGESLAYGIEASIRQVTGRVTGSAGYTLSRSRTTAGGMEFPAAADRTHVLDATIMVQLLPALRLGAAFTRASGAPYTPVAGDTASCLALPECQPAELPWAGEPNSRRGPHFASLDLVTEWTTRFLDTEIGIYAQLRNALGRDNRTVYIGGGTGCLPDGCDEAGLHNAYERGIPRLPVVGIRVRR